MTLQVVILTLALTVLWGVHFGFSVRAWVRTQTTQHSRKDTIVAFRRLATAWCIFLLPLAFLVRNGLAYAGYEDAIIGQLLFFTLAGSNLVGGVFAVVSWLSD